MFWSNQISPWVSQHSFSLIIVFCLLVLACVVYLLTFNSKLSSVLTGASTSHAGTDHSAAAQNDALRYPAALDLDPPILQITNRYLQEKKNVGLLVPPTARLVEELALTPGDLDTAIRDLLAATGRSYPHDRPALPLRTIADLARYVQNAPPIRK